MARRLEYIIAVIVNAVLLYIANNLLNWNITFVTESWSLVLPLLNLALVATIIANLIFLLYDPFLFRESVQLILSVLGIVFLYTLYLVFPFDFYTLSAADWITPAVRIAIALAIIGILISMIVGLFRILRGPKGTPARDA